MEILKINRKGKPVYVRSILISELDKSKCSLKFLSHIFPISYKIYVKCLEDGTLDLRGKKQEYRIILEDKI